MHMYTYFLKVEINPYPVTIAQDQYLDRCLDYEEYIEEQNEQQNKPTPDFENGS